jgi:hypothetical protein
MKKSKINKIKRDKHLVMEGVVLKLLLIGQ